MTPIVSWIGKAAKTALLSEVSTTPKPGLVDIHDNGAHKDMCYHTFLQSTKAIVPYITEMAEIGSTFRGNPKDLFLTIRPVGIKAEQAMFQATKGVNTHKGLIFSLGILASASAWYYEKKHCFDAETILYLCRQMTYDVLEQDFTQIDKKKPVTHGEKLFVLYGERGIRGEVQSGFLSIRNISLPVMRQLFCFSYEKNQVYLHTLLTLMAHVNDTNVLIRTNMQTLQYVKEESKKILALGGGCTSQGIEAVQLLNQDFIHKNISPGGCADLLAATIFIWLLEHYEEGL